MFLFKMRPYRLSKGNTIHYQSFLIAFKSQKQLNSCSSFSSVQLLSCVQLFETPWTVACQASRSITIPRPCSNSCPLSQSCHQTISSSVVPFSSFLQSFPSIRVFYNESVICIRWTKYWSFSISSSNEYSGLISFRIDKFNKDFKNSPHQKILEEKFIALARVGVFP